MKTICEEPIGIIILNYNLWEETIRCVDSIMDHCAVPCKIIVVDNVSPNDSYEQLKRHLSDERYTAVDVIQSDYNGGYSYGNNFGFRYCVAKYKSKYLIFSNSDILFQRGTVENLIKALRVNADALAAGPLVKNPKGDVESLPMKSARVFGDMICTRGWRKRVYSVNDLQNLKQVYLVSGCCFVVNAELFEEIGCFDEGVFLYEEEHILSFKAQRMHYTIWFEPRAEVVHKHGSTTGTGKYLCGERASEKRPLLLEKV